MGLPSERGEASPRLSRGREPQLPWKLTSRPPWPLVPYPTGGWRGTNALINGSIEEWEELTFSGEWGPTLQARLLSEPSSSERRPLDAGERDRELCRRRVGVPRRSQSTCSPTLWERRSRIGHKAFHDAQMQMQDSPGINKWGSEKRVLFRVSLPPPPPLPNHCLV